MERFSENVSTNMARFILICAGICLFFTTFGMSYDVCQNQLFGLFAGTIAVSSVVNAMYNGIVGLGERFTSKAPDWIYWPMFTLLGVNIILMVFSPYVAILLAKFFLELFFRDEVTWSGWIGAAFGVFNLMLTVSFTITRSIK